MKYKHIDIALRLYFSLVLYFVLQSLQSGIDWATPSRLSLCINSECNSSNQKIWPHCAPYVKSNPVPLGLILIAF